MSEKENTNEKLEAARTVKETTVEQKVEKEKEAEETASKEAPAVRKKSNVKAIAISVVVVVVIVLGVLYQLEKEGRSSTQIFSSLIEKQRLNKEVASVNGHKLTNADLDLSIKQFAQIAAAQGVDVESDEAKSRLRKQALEVLINTTLLKQEAAKEGIGVFDEEINQRYDDLLKSTGGEEALGNRMKELGITKERLLSDIRDELVIQKLIDKILADANSEITEEEISEVYNTAKENNTDIPPLAEVKDQVEAQIRATKEQTAIEDYLKKLKEEAEINIIE